MRIEQLTFTRFFAAISIVILHFGLDIYPFNLEFINNIFAQSDMWVSYFFILSGFVLMIAYGNKRNVNTYDFLKNRFARIYPIYLLAIILLYFYYTFQKTQIDIYELILNVFMIQAWIPLKSLSFNIPGWSLSVELIFYLIFPLLFNTLFKFKNQNKIIIIILFLWFVTQIIFIIYIINTYQKGIYDYIHNFVFYNPLMHINEFLIGNLAGYFFLNKLSNIRKRVNWLLLLLFMSLWLILQYPIGHFFHNGLMAILFIPIILLLSINKGFVSNISNTKFFVFLGEISYGIYILQLPIYLWTYRILSHFNYYDKTISFYLYTIILILFTSLSYIYFETPIRKLIKRKFKFGFD